MERDGKDRTAVKEQSSRTTSQTRKRGKTGARVAEISGKTLGRMIEAFTKLPGIGRKSAERLAFAVLGMPREEAAGIAQAILDLKNNSRYCSVCNNITEEEMCGICRDERRDGSRICVVEEPSNILILEKTGIFRGRYHALLGAISPLDGIGPGDLKIDGLMERLRSGVVREVIIATNPTVKGETTALYLSRLIKPLGISVSRIAYGLPVGGDIEYADENTVQRALEGRREM
ncbi:MAG: recombination mediator RecR [Betaproteobacteria bacterium]